MNAKKLVKIPVGVLFTGLLFSLAAPAQIRPERLSVARERIQQAKSFFDKMPENRQRILSGGAQNLLQLTRNWDKVIERLPETPARLPSTGAGTSVTAQAAQAGLVPVQVSNPSADFLFSQLAGFTQSETSTGWCGSNVVAGFNDSGSFAESIFFGPGGLSFNGAARSTDRGASFTDLGFLNPGPDPSNFLIGDPVVGCTDSNTFYYASLFLTDAISAISVSKSSDAGATFADPVVAAGKDLSMHFLDKPWMAVDPTDSSRIFVTYTDFDFSGVCGFTPDGQLIGRIAIEFVRSIDGGNSWSSPAVLEQVCSPPTVPGLFVQGSQIAVGPAGEVYVAWEFFAANFVGRTIRLRKSLDHGASFAPPSSVTSVACVGGCFSVRGDFRTFIDLGSLVVDRSGKATNGTVYVVWHDGRNLQTFDLDSFSGAYGFADILIRRSTNGGLSWSPPIRVNQNPDPVPGGGGTDQYMAGAAVDKDGTVGVCFYDRRLDPANFFIDRFCAISLNAGLSWLDSRQSAPSFAPFHASDDFINPAYMGDYDTLASDATNSNSGFVGAFQIIDTRGNPDVKALKLSVP